MAQVEAAKKPIMAERTPAPAPLWTDSDALLTVEVFRDGIIALVAIVAIRYVYNHYWHAKEEAAASTPSLPLPNTRSLYPIPPPPSILTTTEAQLHFALSTMKEYGVHPTRGFLPPRDPCTQLSNPRCEEWEIFGTQLPDLLSAGQCRQVLSTMKAIDWHCIGTSRAQQRRAFLLLSAMANAYLWCEPDNIVDVLPSNIAVPLHHVAQALGIQPALVHASIVLANWRRLDPKGPITTDNITTLIDILGGRDEKWFFLLTVEIEFVGAPALLPCLLLQAASDTMRTHLVANDHAHATAWVEYGIALLGRIQQSIDGMTQSFQKMHKQCDPYIFYHRVRPFLSGTKGNPTLPNGVIYEGVNNNVHKQCSGGSAAQSSLLPIFDATLGVQHNAESFIKEMREYMPSEHRAFILYVQEQNQHSSEGEEETSSITQVLALMQPQEHEVYHRFIQTYNETVHSLTTFRNLHMEMVKVYIVAEQRKAAMATAKAKGERSLGDAAGGKGTGGTGIMSFLKPMRNRTREKVVKTA